jgi:hypothetical protein
LRERQVFGECVLLVRGWNRLCHDIITTKDTTTTRTTTNHVTWILKHDLHDVTKGREATFAMRRRGDPHDSGVQVGCGSMGQADLDSAVQAGLDSMVQVGLDSLVQAGLDLAAVKMLHRPTRNPYVRPLE